jgi:serine/threonine protein kinase
MGLTVNTTVEELPCFKKTNKDTIMQYPIRMAKQFSSEVCEALEFLHQNNVAHGDLQPRSISFTLKNLEHVREESGDRLRQRENFKNGSTSLMRRKGGIVDK